MKDGFPTARVIERIDLSSNLMILKTEPSVAFSHKPGQYATIGLDGIWRPYSIASDPRDRILEFFIELVEYGKLTPLLWKLRPGDEVFLKLTEGKGKFRFEADYQTHFMVCTVTGVAPYISMIRHLISSGPAMWQGYKIYLFQGASYQHEYGYDEYLRRLEPLVTYIPTVSRPRDPRNQGWEKKVGHRRRVNYTVRPWMLKHRIDPAGRAAYLCGHPGMVGYLAKKLPSVSFLKRTGGAGFDVINREVYFKV